MVPIKPNSKLANEITVAFCEENFTPARIPFFFVKRLNDVDTFYFSLSVRFQHLWLSLFFTFILIE